MANRPRLGACSEGAGNDREKLLLGAWRRENQRPLDPSPSFSHHALPVLRRGAAGKPCPSFRGSGDSVNPAVPARASLPPWAQGLHRSASSIHGGAELPLGTHQTCSTTSAAPGSHLARGNTRGEPENDAPSLHLKQNSKRRTDLCNSRLALRIAGTRSGARLGPA